MMLDQDETTATKEPTRQLVALGPDIARAAASLHTRPSASFVVHLIAAHENWPQLRAMRRGEPEVASAAYERTHAPPRRDSDTPAPCGRLASLTI